MGVCACVRVCVRACACVRVSFDVFTTRRALARDIKLFLFVLIYLARARMLLAGVGVCRQTPYYKHV